MMGTLKVESYPHAKKGMHTGWGVVNGPGYLDKNQESR
jgi:hypothetical protein